MSNEKLINTNHSLDYLSDSFNIDLADFAYYIEEKSEVSIPLGYGAKNVTQIDGIIDQFVINRTGGKSATMAIKGRDYLRIALERNFRKVYLYKLPEEKRENAGTSGPASVVPELGSGTGYSGVIPPDPSGSGRRVKRFRPRDEFGEYIPYATGHIRASRVASDACTSIGFELVWDAPDYYIVNERENEKGFNGTVSSVLLDLISILNHTEMFKIDIFVKSKSDTDKTPVIYVKKRVFPYIADQTIELEDIRITSLSITIDKYKERPIRNIYVSQDVIGDSQSPEPDDEETDPGAPQQVPTGEPPSEDDQWIKAPEEDERIVETYNKYGIPIIREVYTSYYINGILIKETKLVYKVAIADVESLDSLLDVPEYLAEERTTVFNYYGGGPYSFYQKLESIQETATIHTMTFWCADEQKNVEANHKIEYPSHSVSVKSIYKSEYFTLLESYTYNSQDEIIVQDNFERHTFYNEQGSSTSVITNQEIKSYEYYSKDQIRTTTTRYVNGVFISSQSVLASGQLPGIKKVAVIRNIQSKKRTDRIDDEDPEIISGGGGTGDIRNETEVLWYKKFKVSLYGSDYKIHSNILSKAQLQAIAKQIKYEYLKTKCILEMSVLPLPWMRKGMKLKIDGTVTDGSGDETHDIDLNDFVFLITDISQSRDAATNKFTGTVKGIAFIET